MSCCGSKRQQAVAGAYAVPDLASAIPSGASGTPASGGPVFVYDGVAGLIVTGRATGRRYRFTERGARLSVDARDAALMGAVPKLRRLST